MEKMMHLAAQYLAAAGISFLEKKEDDSHTNLGFLTEKGILFTRALNENKDFLALNCHEFTLEWRRSGESQNLFLDGKTHEEVIQWVEQMSSEAGISKPYRYDFHYDLPYSISADFRYLMEDRNRLNELLALRIIAQNSLKAFLSEKGLDSEIRVWPHHFDTGIFLTSINDSNLSIGMGLAIPDSVCEDHYLYVSGYRDHNSIDPKEFKVLSNGTWKTNGFKGAVLEASGISEVDAASFFAETFMTYKMQS